MAKGYWVARVDVSDEEGYNLMRRQSGIFKKFGARFIVRGGKYEPLEGSTAPAMS